MAIMDELAGSTFDRVTGDRSISCKPNLSPRRVNIVKCKFKFKFSYKFLN
jgi:hypothetical protein